MLSIAVAEEIDRLLKEGQLSQRKIAARLGVSRGTVSAMANGQRGVFGREGEPERLRGGGATLGIAARCCPCGYLVYMPAGFAERASIGKIRIRRGWRDPRPGGASPEGGKVLIHVRGRDRLAWHE